MRDAADVMGSAPPMLGADALVPAALDAVRQDGMRSLLVGTPSRLIGVTHYEQLIEAVESGRLNDPVGELLDDELVHVHPDHGPDVVLPRLAASNGLLPVVSREDAQRLVGVITFDGVRRFMRDRSRQQ